MAAVASGLWKLTPLPKREVGEVVSERLDPVEDELRLTDLPLVGPVVAEVPRPVAGVAVHPRPVDLELLVGQLDQAQRGDGDGEVAGRCRGSEGG